MAGTVDGINEAGLAVTLNDAYTTDRNRPAPTISMRLAETLTKCRTVPEACHYLTHPSRCGGGLIMLADAHEAAASVELTPAKHFVRTGSPGEIVTHANRVCGVPTLAVQLPENAV